MSHDRASSSSSSLPNTTSFSSLSHVYSGRPLNSSTGRNSSSSDTGSGSGSGSGTDTGTGTGSRSTPQHVQGRWQPSMRRSPWEEEEEEEEAEAAAAAEQDQEQSEDEDEQTPSSPVSLGLGQSFLASSPALGRSPAYIFNSQAAKESESSAAQPSSKRSRTDRAVRDDEGVSHKKQRPSSPFFAGSAPTSHRARSSPKASGVAQSQPVSAANLSMRRVLPPVPAYSEEEEEEKRGEGEGI